MSIDKPVRSQKKSFVSLKWLLVAVPLGYLLVVFYYAVVNIFKLSVSNDNGFTLEYLAAAFTNPTYLNVLFVTIKTAIAVTAVSLILGYPIAYALVVFRKNWQRITLSVIVISLWISLLARTYSWVLVLQKDGVVNRLLQVSGLRAEPLDLLYSFLAVVIGMVHILIPFMVLNIFPVLQGIDLRLMDAAKNLGSTPASAFYRVFLPLSLPGIVSGSVIVFVNSLGYFVTPALLGGRNDMLISQLIELNVNTTFDWNFAAALSVMLLIAALCVLGLGRLLTRLVPSMPNASI